jgi:hypothetical protein
VSTQVVALTGHDLIQNVPQQTVNIVREDTRTDNSLVRQPTAGQNDRNIGHNPVTQTMDANERVEMYSRVSPPKEHQNNSACCVSSDTPAGDTRGGMVIETPSPGPNSQSGIGGYSGIGAIRTPQQHGRFISSTEKSVYSENNSSSLFLATGRSVEIGRGGGGGVVSQMCQTPEAISRIHDSISAHISLKIKENIWRGEYIHFGLLL